MLRLIAATVLIVHLLFMLFFAASGKAIVTACMLVCFLALLFVYFRKKVLSPVILAGLGVYLVALVAFYIALVIGSVQIGRPANIWFHSFVFLPGITAATAYIGYVREDRRKRLPAR